MNLLLSNINVIRLNNFPNLGFHDPRYVSVSSLEIE